MAKGKIKRIIRDRGFGFIEAEDGSEIFFHRTSLAGTDFNDLKEGDGVEFETEQTPKGPRATNVKGI